MSPIEHSQIYNHTAKQATFAQTKKYSGRNEPTVGFGETKERAYDPPGGDQCGKVSACFEVFQDPVGWYIN